MMFRLQIRCVKVIGIYNGAGYGAGPFELDTAAEAATYRADGRNPSNGHPPIPCRESGCEQMVVELVFVWIRCRLLCEALTKSYLQKSGFPSLSPELPSFGPVRSKEWRGELRDIVFV